MKSPTLALSAVLLLAGLATSQAESLFNGHDLNGWHADVPALDKDHTLPSPFIVRDGKLVSLGKPAGHLITDASHENYRLTVEYRFSATPGNCGVLVHASKPRALYGMFPQSIECQMMHGNAGDFWCIAQDITVPNMEARRGPRENWGVDGKKQRRIPNLTDNSEKPVGEWNTLVVECLADKIKVWVNGDLVNYGYDCQATRGQIALQAEGSEVEFRKVELTPISALTVTAAELIQPVVLEHTEHRSIRSEKIGQTYDLFVSLPADYQPDEKAGPDAKRYPVLYVLDGWHFPLLAYLQNNNLYSGRMPPVIIVNLGHGQGINPMPLRARDFTPTAVAVEPTSGGAAAFLEFLEQEIIPLVDRTYRTDPADRALLGHSYGGLFALYALEERPGLFQRIVAASPVAGWDQALLAKAAPDKLKNLAKPVRLDLSVGDDEHSEVTHDISAEVIKFAGLLDGLKPANLDYRFTLYRGENHNSVRMASFPAGLYWVYRR